jgi:membrane dipeptidase
VLFGGHNPSAHGLEWTKASESFGGMNDTPIVDAHLDLADNVTLFGRDLTTAAHARRAAEPGTIGRATVSLPDLERGGVAVVCATVTAGFLVADVGEEFEPRSAIYGTPEEAEAQAMTQIALYEEWERRGLVRLLKSVGDLDHHLELWREDRRPGIVMLMEGADPIVHVRDLTRWWRRGLRMIGLTFGDTRYGAGVGGGSQTIRRGGLTPEGVALLEQMTDLGFIWDISHLAEDGVWQGLELGFPRVCVSHANARALTPTDRHLSDEVMRAVAERQGVIGLVLFNGFLEPAWTRDPHVEVTLDDQLRRHAHHVARVAGWSCIGIGSDLDGGFGCDESPAEIDTVADLRKVGSVVPADAVKGVLGENWLRFLRRSLPPSA